MVRESDIGLFYDEDEGASVKDRAQSSMGIKDAALAADKFRVRAGAENRNDQWQAGRVW